MMWFGMFATIAAVPLMYGVGPPWGLWLALIALAVCFATFCLLYDEPVRRARARMARRLADIAPNGAMSEEFHRLQSSALQPTAEERAMRLGPMLVANLAAGAAGTALVVWGIALRIS
jgi:hypothetical protein